MNSRQGNKRIGKQLFLHKLRVEPGRTKRREEA